MQRAGCEERLRSRPHGEEIFGWKGMCFERFQGRVLIQRMLTHLLLIGASTGDRCGRKEQVCLNDDCNHT
jgi:hypothetical protein